MGCLTSPSTPTSWCLRTAPSTGCPQPSTVVPAPSWSRTSLSTGRIAPWCSSESGYYCPCGVGGRAESEMPEMEEGIPCLRSHSLLWAFPVPSGGALQIKACWSGLILLRIWGFGIPSAPRYVPCKAPGGSWRSLTIEFQGQDFTAGVPNVVPVGARATTSSVPGASVPGASDPRVEEACQ